MQEKSTIIKAETQEEKEHLRNNADALKAELKKSSADDIINPEIYKYLSEKESGQLRRWVNQFIKENAEKEDDESIVYPYMNKGLRNALERARLKLQAIATAKYLKEVKKNETVKH